MSHRNLSLEDFAQYVGMDPDRVKKLADRGEIPGDRIGGDWRFNRARVHDWLQQHLLTVNGEELLRLERAMFEDESEQWSDLVVTNLMEPSGIELDLRARTRASVLREMVDLASRTSLVYDPKEILLSIEEREQISSTAVGDGLAFPHPRKPLLYATAEPLVCMGRIDRGIAFGAPDGTLSYLFFLMCPHDHRHHLHVLARLVRMLDSGTVSDLMEVEDPADALQVLIDREQSLIDAER